MQREELQSGLYVRFQPRHGPLDDLESGAIGINTDPSWQDVGVQWIGRERDHVSQAVYDYEDLERLDTLSFLSACSRLYQTLKENQ